MAKLFLVILLRRPLLSLNQKNRLSEFLSNMAVASFAVTILPVLFRLDTIPPLAVVLGVTAGIFFLSMSIKFAAGGENNYVANQR